MRQGPAAGYCQPAAEYGSTHHSPLATTTPLLPPPQLDLERLLQRYRNVKNELEAQQNLERIRMEKMTQGGV